MNEVLQKLFLIIFAIMIVTLSSSSATADPIYTLNMVEEKVIIPMEKKSLFGTRSIRLSATIYRPKSEGIHPLLILNHGSTRNPEHRKKMFEMKKQSSIFVNKGFVVVVAMRRGYRDSEGGWAETFGKCDSPHYSFAAKEAVKDIRAVSEYMKKKDYVDPARTLMAGQSGGGFASLAYASAYPDELLGVINFSGGRGGATKRHGVCEPKKLINTVGGFGKDGKLPTLWIYSENDSMFPPPLPKQMFQEYIKNGGKGKIVLLTSKEAPSGHKHFVKGIKIWEPIVDDFLQDIGLLERDERSGGRIQ